MLFLCLKTNDVPNQKHLQNAATDIFFTEKTPNISITVIILIFTNHS